MPTPLRVAAQLVKLNTMETLHHYPRHKCKAEDTDVSVIDKYIYIDRIVKFAKYLTTGLSVNQ